MYIFWKINLNIYINLFRIFRFAVNHESRIAILYHYTDILLFLALRKARCYAYVSHEFSLNQNKFSELHQNEFFFQKR
jgi:hypothetical protein